MSGRRNYMDECYPLTWDILHTCRREGVQVVEMQGSHHIAELPQRESEGRELECSYLEVQ